MSRVWRWLLFGVSITILAQQPAPTASKDQDVMLAAVSRNESMFAGGIGPGKWTGRGTVAVEPLARLTQAGEWRSIPCKPGTGENCREFAREYLSKPHAYKVISADGKGATIHAAPSTLSECYGYTGTGTYTGARIAKSAIAASSVDLFEDSPPPQRFDPKEAEAIRKALAKLPLGSLDSTEQLHFFHLSLEGQDMVVVQRAFADVPATSEQFRLIFAIGTMSQGRFDVLHRKGDDEDERVLGTIRLKSGRDFLITVVSDPESQWFRVYGIRGGRLALIYSGGGSSC